VTLRKEFISILVCLLTTLLFAANGSLKPLNVKTGLWQMTKTVTWTGLPPQIAATMKNGQPIHYKSCVKEKDLSTNPWAEGSHQTCVWTVLNSTGSDMEVRGASCDLGKEYGMTAEVHGKIHALDRESGTGSFAITLTGNGQTMKGNASYTGKWVSQNCPANMN
jgi:hypothetical protein